MASIQKTAKGYRAQIKLLGTRDSRVFSTRREAIEWAAQRERQIRDIATKPAADIHTLRDALEKFCEEEAPKRRGSRWEEIRLLSFQRDSGLPLDLPMSQVNATHIAAFRDARLLEVKPSSVLRELTLLSAVFQAAILEWRWISSNPCREIRKPRQPQHRERTILWWEVRRMLRQMGWRPGVSISTTSQAVAGCMLMALRTGMRAGELCSLRWEHVSDAYVHLPITKNGRRRDVPLSSRARRLIHQMRGWDDELVFGLKAASLDALFRKHRAAAGLSGFTFHDTRHTAATMLSRKVDVLTLCKIFGWSNTKQALTYYNPSATSIADMLG